MQEWTDFYRGKYQLVGYLEDLEIDKKSKWRPVEIW
jgi:hypothetical protein